MKLDICISHIQVQAWSLQISQVKSSPNAKKLEFLLPFPWTSSRFFSRIILQKWAEPYFLAPATCSCIETRTSDPTSYPGNTPGTKFVTENSLGFQCQLIITIISTILIHLFVPGARNFFSCFLLRFTVFFFFLKIIIPFSNYQVFAQNQGKACSSRASVFFSGCLSLHSLYFLLL